MSLKLVQNNYYLLLISPLLDTPTILITPTDQLTPEGQDISLTCFISPITDISISYIWSKDGQTVNTSNPRVIPRSNGTLSILEFNSDINSGRYECTVVLTAQGTNANSLYHVIGSAFLSTG